MHVTAKADYAVRAVVELADSSPDSPRRVDSLAEAQGIPVSFLENILPQLRSSGIVRSRRGPMSGNWLSRPPAEVNLAGPRSSNTWARQRRSRRFGSRCG